jgi:hypothetical protein
LLIKNDSPSDAYLSTNVARKKISIGSFVSVAVENNAFVSNEGSRWIAKINKQWDRLRAAEFSQLTTKIQSEKTGLPTTLRLSVKATSFVNVRDQKSGPETKKSVHSCIEPRRSYVLMNQYI